VLPKLSVVLFFVVKKDLEHKGKGHRQRLREKFLNRGIESLNDDEVLELLLTLGTPRKDCKEQARALLRQFGSLPAVLESSIDTLQEVKGIGPQNGFAIHFIQGVARRYLNQRLKSKDYLRSSKEVAEYLNHSMRHLKKEVFKVIFLDAGLAIIETQTVFEGTLASNTIYPRELIKMVLDNHAAAVVIAHNHPSGSQTPSAADRKLTRNLYLACAVMDIRLLDHLIIGKGEAPFSFADHGIMEEIKEECQRLL
jgi:DNA repair protein RadC